MAQSGRRMARGGRKMAQNGARRARVGRDLGAERRTVARAGRAQAALASYRGLRFAECVHG